MLDNAERPYRSQEIKDWLVWARRPWNPVAAAERQFDALALEGEEAPGLAAYDHLEELATQALQRLQDHPCPDGAVGDRFMAKMTAYLAFAKTVRSTIAEVREDAAAAGLCHPQGVVAAHGKSSDHSISSDRRQAPRRAVGWPPICHIERESAEEWRECRVIEISMLGFAMTLNQPSASELVGRYISVEIPELSDSFNLRLGGAIRDTGPAAGGVVRVGIEFDGRFPIGGVGAPDRSRPVAAEDCGRTQRTE